MAATPDIRERLLKIFIDLNPRQLEEFVVKNLDLNYALANLIETPFPEKDLIIKDVGKFLLATNPECIAVEDIDRDFLENLVPPRSLPYIACLATNYYILETDIAIFRASLKYKLIRTKELDAEINTVLRSIKYFYDLSKK